MKRDRGCHVWLLGVRRYIEIRFREKLSLSAIARNAGVHPAHLARTFHTTFGITVGAYIRRLRIEATIQDLKHKTKPVVEIALDAGFYDQSHFHHVFKKHTGLTPSEYVRLEKTS
jgi:AraC family transcriptional regulator